jgi:hypothetical protein
VSVLICEKARSGIEIKTLREMSDLASAEATVSKKYQGKWFIYEVSGDAAPRLRVTYDFRHRPTHQPAIKRYT